MIDWIVEYMLDNGYSPTKSEIEMEFNLNSSTANAWLKEAKGRGLLDYGPSTPRTFQVPGVYYVDERGK